MRKYWIGILSLLLLTSCHEDKTSIPDYAVYIDRNLDLDAIELRTIGNGMEITEENKKTREYVGFGGILLFHGYDDEIYAFDMACPYEVRREVKVHFDNNITPGYVKCESCGSTYNVGYGSGNRIDGPGNEGLKRYNVVLSGNSLKVTR